MLIGSALGWFVLGRTVSDPVLRLLADLAEVASEAAVRAGGPLEGRLAAAVVGWLVAPVILAMVVAVARTLSYMAGMLAGLPVLAGIGLWYGGMLTGPRVLGLVMLTLLLAVLGFLLPGLVHLAAGVIAGACGSVIFSASLAGTWEPSNRLVAAWLEAISATDPGIWPAVVNWGTAGIAVAVATGGVALALTGPAGFSGGFGRGMFGRGLYGPFSGF